MKKTETFGGAVRAALAANSIAFVGRLYSDGRKAGAHRVKAITDTRIAGKKLYSMYKSLTEQFPEYTVKVERYAKKTYAFGEASGVTVKFTKKAEA